MSRLVTPITASLTRRAFLRRAGALCGTAAAFSAAPAFARLAECRTLSFVHTHTGEALTTQYFEAGGYRPDCLTQINRLLRDFRTGEVHRIDPTLLDILFDLQVMADREAPFEIISAYRSPATNGNLRRASTGVAKHSLHLDGKAIDVRLNGFPTRKLGELARDLRRGGVGFYAASDFVHLDTGRVRFW